MFCNPRTSAGLRRTPHGVRRTPSDSVRTPRFFFGLRAPTRSFPLHNSPHGLRGVRTDSDGRPSDPAESVRNLVSLRTSAGRPRGVRLRNFASAFGLLRPPCGLFRPHADFADSAQTIIFLQISFFFQISRFFFSVRQFPRTPRILSDSAGVCANPRSLGVRGAYGGVRGIPRTPRMTESDGLHQTLQTRNVLVICSN